MKFAVRNKRSVLPITELLEGRTFLSAAAHPFVTQTNLISNQPGAAAFQNTQLVNAWGISFAPGGEFWISDNGSGYSSQADGTGAVAVPPLVTIPGAGGAATSNPTGQVFAGGTMSFNGAPQIFVFVGEDGGISGWPGSGNAAIIRDNSASGAVYKGAAIAPDANGHSELFVANFNSGAIEVYDNTFSRVTPGAGAFSDKKIPKGYAPFNVQTIGTNLYVTYAKQNAEKHDDVSGNGHGYVDVYDVSGTLVRRFAHGSFLNSPWGVAQAPSTWGSLAGDILVGQFGNGRIDIFTPGGKSLGFLRDSKNKPVSISGLWALTPGPGSATASANDIFFSSGPTGEKDGLFGKLTFNTGKKALGGGPTTTPNNPYTGVN